jgi:hypothetical protein
MLPTVRPSALKSCVGISFGISLCLGVSAQSPLNPSFEAVVGGACQYNIPNATFNANMANCTAFGVASQLDIINSGCGFGTAQSGSYFVALAIDITNTQNDAFTMTLSAPLVMGNSYTLTYYDKADPGYATNLMQVGISTAAGTFGSLIYTSPLPTMGVWTLRTVNFVAPNNGQYLSMRTVVGSYGWNHVDNFQITPALPADVLTFSGRASEGNVDLLEWAWADDPQHAQVELEYLNLQGEFEPAQLELPLGQGTHQLAVDLPQPPVHQYRLKMSDVDGTTNYSAVVVIERTAPAPAMVAFPSPSNGSVSLQLENVPPGQGPATLRTIDLDGRLLQEISVDLQAPISLDLAPFGSGLRLLQLALPDGSSLFTKVLIQQ